MIHVCSGFRYLISTNVVKFLPRYFCSKHNLKSISNENLTQNKVNIDKETITLLERLSLVKCDSAEGVKVLEDSIVFADQILHINVDNVKPLYTVLENESTDWQMATVAYNTSNATVAASVQPTIIGLKIEFGKGQENGLRNLNLRPDKVTQGNCRKDILKNAKQTEEDYFVAPPGNIPLSELEED